MGDLKMLLFARHFKRTGAILFVFFCLISCSEKKKVAENSELVIGVSQDYRATDVFSHKGFNCLVFETLVKMDEKGNFQPFLAERWKVSEDGKQYTFHLRQDISFSDRTHMTAQQVKESLFYRKTRERKRGSGGRPPGIGSPGASSMAKPDSRVMPPRKQEEGKSIGDNQFKRERPYGENGNQGGNSAFSLFDNERYDLHTWYPFDSVEVLDDYTLRFNLPRPYTFFLHEIATTHMFPVLKIDDGETVTGYIGTGPFKIKEHRRAQYMILVKNANYWQGQVAIDRIRLKVIPDAETRAIALEAGEIHLTGYDHFDKIPNESVTRLKKLLFVRTKTMGTPDQPSVSYLVINYQKEPFTDLRVRKAIAFGVDRKPLHDMMSETGRVLGGPFPSDHRLNNPRINAVSYNPVKAKALLAETGWTDTNGDGILHKNGEEFSLKISFSFFDPQYKIVAELIQAQLKALGISANLEMLELGAHVNVMRNKDYDLAFWPLMRYHMFFYTGHPSWLNVYNTPPLDHAFAQYLHGSDHQDTYNALMETQRIIQESYVFPVFFERQNVVAWNAEKLDGFDPMPLGWDLSMVLWKARLS
jgi:peptide/nickel transport system substrate-binding protein